MQQLSASSSSFSAVRRLGGSSPGPAGARSAGRETVAPERSGMAASTVNTFRELGGVFGVAVLGAILNAQLTSHLTSRLRKLGIPANFRSFVIRQVTHGGAEKLHGAGGGRSGLVHQVISAAYAAFGTGLHLALLIAGSMLLAAAVIAFVAMRRPRMILQRPEARSR